MSAAEVRTAKKKRPRPNLDRLDLDAIPARGIELNFSRWSNAYGGKGKGSRKGAERGTLKVSGAKLVTTWELAVKEFGEIRAEFGAELVVGKDNTLSLVKTKWADPVRSGRAAGSQGKGGGWSFAVKGPGEQAEVAITELDEAIPVSFKRFVPLLMPRKKGAAFGFRSLPEDAFPWWSPKAKGSFFPLDRSPGYKTIVCRGRHEQQSGRQTISGWLYEEVSSEVETRWLVGEAGIEAIEFKTTVLRPEDRRIVLEELKAR